MTLFAVSDARLETRWHQLFALVLILPSLSLVDGGSARGNVADSAPLLSMALRVRSEEP